MRIQLIFLSSLLSLSSLLGACSRQNSVSGTTQVFVTEANEAQDEPEEDCQANHSPQNPFLPQTAHPSFKRILPAQKNDCGFYNWAWQSFLYVSQPNPQNQPAFVDFEGLDQVFGLASNQKIDEPLLLNGGVQQAGDQAAILVDSNRNPIYYSIHTNSIFNQFVKQNKLNDLSHLLKTPEQGGPARDLEFPPGALELKAAWQIVETHEDASKRRDYFTMRVRVPILKNQGVTVVPTQETRTVTVALLSLHVVGVVEDHPEFIWATFEHVNTRQISEPLNAVFDLAPPALQNALQGQIPTLKPQAINYSLFDPHASITTYNRVPERQNIDLSTQKFEQSTPIYRAYPASLSDSVKEDHGIKTLNQDISRLFEQVDPSQHDPRSHYRLVGAVWLDKPDAKQPNGVFQADRNFENQPGHKILAGEDNLASMAMESFVQTPQTNCLSCHNTRAQALKSGKLFPPRRINVSNVMSYMSQEAESVDD